MSKVTAECHSDDRVFECNFDAIPWLKKATAKDIIALAQCGWGGDYPADEVAMYMAGIESDIAFMFKYIEKKNNGCNRDHIGFECYVDSAPAFTWLKKNRPNIFRKIPKEDA